MVALRDLDAEIAAWEREVDRRKRQPDRLRFNGSSVSRAQAKLRSLLAERDGLVRSPK